MLIYPSLGLTLGSILKADVSGQIIMRAFLSGMPECKFGLNDRLNFVKDEHTSAFKDPDAQ